MSRRVGLLGGTFDPPHLGHLVVAECARVELPLDEVRLLVAGEPWMKGPTTPAHHRVAMAAAAVADDPHLVVDDRETHREGATYTADTLAELRGAEPDTDRWFLLGEDAAAELPRWSRIEEAFALATFVVVTRPGHRPPPTDELPGPVVHLQVPQLEVSSSELRQRFAEGRATRYLVPHAVDRYVRAHRLYGGARASRPGAAVEPVGTHVAVDGRLWFPGAWTPVPDPLEEHVPATDEAVRLAVAAADAADDKKATDPTILEVADLMALVDVFLLVSTSSARQLKAVAEHVEHRLRELHERRPLRREGTAEAGWYLLDYGDLVCHVFTAEQRELYALERLWADVPRRDPSSGDVVAAEVAVGVGGIADGAGA